MTTASGVSTALSALPKIVAANQEVADKRAAAEQAALDQFLAADKIDPAQAVQALKTLEDQKKVFEDQRDALNQWGEQIVRRLETLQQEGSPAFVDALKEQLAKLNAEIAKHDQQEAELSKLVELFEGWFPKKGYDTGSKSTPEKKA